MKSNETTKALIKSAYIILVAVLLGITVYQANRVYQDSKQAERATAYMMEQTKLIEDNLYYDLRAIDPVEAENYRDRVLKNKEWINR